MLPQYNSPLLAEIEITEHCNLNCQHCYNHYAYPRSGKNHMMQIEDAKRIVQKLIDCDIFHILVTGGEPLCNQSTLLEILSFCNKKNVETTINTNGTLLDASIISKLKEYEVRHLLVSICGPSPVIHDSISGTKGSFERTLKGIKKLVSNKIPFAVNMVIQKDNFLNVYATAEKLAKIGVTTFCATPISPCSVSADHERLMLSSKEILVAWKQLLDAEIAFGLETTSVNPIPLCHFDCTVGVEYMKFLRTKCAAGQLTACVSYNGNIRACTHSSKVYGNILLKEMNSIWNSLDEWRNGELVPDYCKIDCQLFSSCRGGCRTAAEAVNGSLDSLDPNMQSAHLDTIYRNPNDSRNPRNLKIVLDNDKTEQLSMENVIIVNPSLRYRKENDNSYLLYADMSNFLTFNEVEMDAFAAIYNELTNCPLTLKKLSQKLGIDEKKLFNFVAPMFQKRIFNRPGIKSN